MQTHHYRWFSYRRHLYCHDWVREHRNHLYTEQMPSVSILYQHWRPEHYPHWTRQVGIGSLYCNSRNIYPRVISYSWWYQGILDKNRHTHISRKIYDSGHVYIPSTLFSVYAIAIMWVVSISILDVRQVRQNSGVKSVWDPLSVVSRVVLFQGVIELIREIYISQLGNYWLGRYRAWVV